MMTAMPCSVIAGQERQDVPWPGCSKLCLTKLYTDWHAMLCYLQVKNGKTFLDLIAEQVKHTRQKFGEPPLA